MCQVYKGARTKINVCAKNCLVCMHIYSLGTLNFVVPQSDLHNCVDTFADVACHSTNIRV